MIAATLSAIWEFVGLVITPTVVEDFLNRKNFLQIRCIRDRLVALYRPVTLEKPLTFGTPKLGGMTRPLTGADLMRQLSEEIRKAYGGRGGVKAFAAELDENYWTYRGYLKGDTQMSATLLLRSLAALGVDELEFIQITRESVAAEDQPAAD